MVYEIISSSVKDGNMSFNYGEYEEVLNNKKRFFEKNSIKNSTKINLVNKDKIFFLDDNSVKELSTDCLITDIKDKFLYLCLGDCIPMVVYDKKQKIISLTHLGWKSICLNLHQKVIHYYIVNLKSDIKNLEIILGPSIKKDSYIIKNPNQLNDKNWKNYLTLVKDEYYKIDINSYVYDGLKRMNIENIINSSIDTVKNKNYFSHYRFTYVDKEIPEGRFIYGVRIK